MHSFLLYHKLTYIYIYIYIYLLKYGIIKMNTCKIINITN